MRKKIISTFMVFSIFSSFLFAEAKDIPKDVPKASKESSELYGKKNWQPWAVGIATVLIAATGITIVALKK